MRYNLVQGGYHPRTAKPWRSLPGTSVWEIVDNHDKDTYRAIYTVRFGEAIYVLHAFQKKSKRGIQTPRRAVEMVKQRFQEAETIHNGYVKGLRK